MLKSYKNKEKMSVRWNTQDITTTNTTTAFATTAATSAMTTATTTTTTATATVITNETQHKKNEQQSISNEIIKQLKHENNDKKTTADNEALLEAALEKAKLAVDEAKIAVETINEVNGKYTNWNNKHAELAAHAWCCIGDLLAFCHKYEFKSISRNDSRLQNAILVEVKSMLHGVAPFSMRQRFPGNIRNPENLWVCIGHCAGIEYHLNRILSTFRKPLEQLSSDKQRLMRQNFHLAVNELHLDITARVLDLRLYDRTVFEREFKLDWLNDT